MGTDGVDHALAVPEANGPRFDLLNPVVEVFARLLLAPAMTALRMPLR
jgi:hypothetical protein